MDARERERQGVKRVNAGFRDDGQGTGSAVFDGKQGGYFRERDRLPGNLMPEVSQLHTVCEAALFRPPYPQESPHPGQRCAPRIATTADLPSTTSTATATATPVLPAPPTLPLYATPDLDPRAHGSNSGRLPGSDSSEP